MNSNNAKIDYKNKIIETLSDYASGLTITDVSNKIKVHRNTVSKYLYILEAEGKVLKKEIGNANLYFTSKRIYLKRSIVASFIKSLFYGIKAVLPNNEQIIKQAGRKMLDNFVFPVGVSYIKEIEQFKAESDPKMLLKIFQEFYNPFDFIQEGVDISIIQLNDKLAIYRFKNSEFLETTDKSIYYFYLMCGIAEGLYLDYFNKVVECDVVNFNISNKKEESFVDISITIK